MIRYIYIIGVTDNPVKIGISDKPSQRLIDLQIGCPDTLTMFWKVPTYHYSSAAIESAVHHELAEHHRRGEWFNVTVEQAKAAIHKVAPDVFRMARKTLRSSKDEVERLAADFDIDADARAAINHYRAALADNPALARRFDTVIAKKAGIGGLVAFRMVFVEQRSLRDIIRRNPGTVGAAEAALAKAINTLADYDAFLREEALKKSLDKICGNRPPLLPTSVTAPQATQSRRPKVA